MPVSAPNAAVACATEPATLSGLSAEVARQRLAMDGPNTLRGQDRRGLFAIAWEVVREPMFILLVAAGVLYVVMGKPGDAAMLLGFVFVVMGITIVQERRTERALDALRELSSPQATVIRDGQRQRVLAATVVRGDWLVLAEGERVPADALLRQGQNLSVDESLLTGESVQVGKTPSPHATSIDPPGGDGLPSLFSGTLIIAGQGVAEVVGTATRTELGKIGVALQSVQSEATLLQRETGRLVRILAIVGLALCAVVVVAYGLSRGGTMSAWRDGALAGIAMAMAILPEEFPVILTIFLALGAWRIARSRVLTRRMPAIETLGAATVLCTDKTGTLTMNQMTVSAVIAGDARTQLGRDAISPAARRVLELAALASRPEPFDPMERAIRQAAVAASATSGSTSAEGWTLVREYPLTPALLTVSHAWQPPPEQSNVNASPAPLLVASKGAPEAIIALCHMSADQRQTLIEKTSALAAEGLRVLGVAHAAIAANALPTEQRTLALEFAGLIALADPLRPGVPAAVAECHGAGIRVLMITGDYPTTAQAIARQAGIANADDCITGTELTAMSDAELAQRIRTVAVFARVAPAQKLRLVQALKANGEVVAMTGDGVNDAPALKAAHIGIAMGGRGTDVARESAALVLLDDDFAAIVAAVKLGRRIFDNLKKAFAFTFAVHVPIVGLSMLPVFMPGWPLLLFPVHIVFLELVIDPSCSLIFEAEDAEREIMQRPPRPPQERLFALKNIWLSLLQGASVLVVCVAIFHYALPARGEDAVRSLVFTALVSGILAIIVINRSWSRNLFAILRMPNAAQWWVVSSAALLLAAVVMIPVTQRLFHFAPVRATDAGIAVIVGLLCVSWFELVKRRRSRRALRLTNTR